MLKLADLHVDTMNRSLERGWDLRRGAEDAHVDVPRLLASNVRCLGLSLWSDPGDDALTRTRRQLEAAESLVHDFPERFFFLTDRASIDSLDQSERIGFLAHVEGAHGIGDSLSVLDEFVSRGVRALTLTWNNANGVADSCVEPRDPPGLTTLGREFVEFLRRRGCIVDLSHASPKTFWDTMELASDRTWVSHSACRSLANHPRNLDDEQIRALGRAGGVVGVILYPLFLNPEDPEAATLETAADHVEHVASVGGLKCVALGSDFDGVTMLPGDLRGIQDLPKLLRVLSRRGWTEDMLRALCWTNPMRVLRGALPG